MKVFVNPGVLGRGHLVDAVCDQHALLRQHGDAIAAREPDRVAEMAGEAGDAATGGEASISATRTPPTGPENGRPESWVDSDAALIASTS